MNGLNGTSVVIECKATIASNPDISGVGVSYPTTSETHVSL